ncbi:MAG TPA: ECF-type sigma factor [Acidobacteriota bacterium]
MPNPSSQVVRDYVERSSAGDPAAAAVLLPLVYGELRKLARGLVRRERKGFSWQPTELVHEVTMRLLRDQRLRVESRAHFIGIAARAMRQILVEHARARGAAKRGAGRSQITLDERLGGLESRSIDLLALDEALEALARLDPKQAELVELRFFGGMTVEETAAALAVSPATVKRRWELAKAFLRRELGP